MTTIHIQTEYAWALGCFLALGIWDALYHGLALGTALHRVWARWVKVRRVW